MLASLKIGLTACHALCIRKGAPRNGSQSLLRAAAQQMRLSYKDDSEERVTKKAQDTATQPSHWSEASVTAKHWLDRRLPGMLAA